MARYQLAKKRSGNHRQRDFWNIWNNKKTFKQKGTGNARQGSKDHLKWIDQLFWLPGEKSCSQLPKN